MEPHPVPQNILDVEFKLFGAFTLKQFGKILAGCLIGIGIFLININIIIKIPLVLISVFGGILLAIIPNFGIWLEGFLKALFISPRYVWEKKTQTPEILSNRQAVVDPEKDRNISSSLNKKKLDINELPLDKLFGTQAAQSKEIVEDKFESPDGENLNDIYSDVFGVTTTAVKRAPAQQAAPIQQKAGIVEEKPKMAMATQVQTENDVKMVGTPKFTTVQEYQAEINRLKYELSILTKDQNYKEKEEEIMSKINDLYTEIKLISGGKFTNSSSSIPKVEVMSSGLEGKVVYGIVVDKADAPLGNVLIKFVNDSQKKVYSSTSSKDGKFSTVKPLPPGNYALFLESPGKQFHAYNIEISNKNLPAYKLKEK